MRFIYLTLFTPLMILLSGGGLPAATYGVVEKLEIDTVPSWFPVGFCLLTHGERQYVAYYRHDHQMIVASRSLDQQQWQKAELPTWVGWDSHNYVTMAVDASGNLHLAGNMHCVPLVYFRTGTPGDVTTFQRRSMTGQEEDRCTYPRFLTDNDGNLLFNYRSGRSGNGRRFYNRYDVEKKTWSRFLDTPLFEGEGKRNAYPLGPVRGPDGLFHLVWVWRDTPDCATNHHLCYARSPDLKNWETAAGSPVRLPLTLEHGELSVDPVPSGGGIINGCEKLTFDSQNRPIVSYHKSDDNGRMQIFATRFEDGKWRPRALTNWDRRIAFSGRGAMPFIGIRIGALTPTASGLFSITFRHRDYGSGRIFVDEGSLQPVDRQVPVPTELPPALSKTTVAFEGMRVRRTSDLGQPADAHVKYVLQWETLAPNHDRPRQPPLPPASPLTLIKLERAQ